MCCLPQMLRGNNTWLRVTAGIRKIVTLILLQNLDVNSRGSFCSNVITVAVMS
jgi:hypothetical protein